MSHSVKTDTILIVDDNYTNLRVLSDALSLVELDVAIATSGEAALKQAEQVQPDLIILDVMMPGISGFETCERLKANPKTQAIPVMFMTALSETVNKVRGLEVGAVDYITKPFQQEEVIARVQTQLKLRKLNQRLEAELQNRRLIEVELSASRAELLGLFAAIQDVIIVFDHNGRYLQVAPSSAPLLYCPQAEILGKTIHEVLPSEIANLFLTHIQQALQTGQPSRLDYRLPIGDRVVYFDGTMAPRPDQTVVLVARDMTNLKEAQQALTEKEHFLQNTMAAGKIACWRWNRFTQQVFWSQGTETLLGLEPGIFGNTFDDYVSFIHPDDLNDLLQALELSLKTGADYQTEHRICPKKEEIQWIRTSGSVWRDQQGEVMGLMGSILNITAAKLAEIKLHESSQRIEKQAQREQIFNQITQQIRQSLDLDSILAKTVQSVQELLRIDCCTFAWYFHQEKQYWDVVAEAKIAQIPSLIGQYTRDTMGDLSDLLLKQEIVQIDQVASLENAQVKAFLTTLGIQSILLLPVFNETGNYGVLTCIQAQTSKPWQAEDVALLVAVADQLAIALNQSNLLAETRTKAAALAQALAELQQTQLRLIQTEKMSSLGKLVAGVAHEINNPVSFIHGNLNHADEYVHQLIALIHQYQRYCPNPDPELAETIAEMDLDFLQADFKDLLQSMRVGTERIRGIVKSLRTFSRLDESEVKNVNLHEGLESALMILDNRLQGQESWPPIEVIKDYGELPSINCYAGQLNQVFMNILTNAIDALDLRDEQRSLVEMEAEPSRIRITTRQEGDRLTIAIADNGPGIAPEAQGRLFDPFFTTKAIGKGTGLGLSISYQIVTENHQGQLICTSEPGATTFLIELPIR